MQGRYGQSLILVVLGIFFGGCALHDAPSMAVYSLEPQWNESEGVPADKRRTLVLQVAPVRGAAPLHTTDILYSDHRHSLQSYAYSRWREAPVSAMQTVLETSLGKSGLYRAVLPMSSEAGTDLILESILLECGHIFGESNSSEGVVRVRFHLVDSKRRMVVADKELVVRVAAASNDAPGAAAAINQAAWKLAGELVVWLSFI